MIGLLDTPTVVHRNITGPERRTFLRTQAYGRIDGQRLDRSPAARRNPHLSVALRDISASGISGWSQTELQPGERLALFFPPEGFNRGFDVRGKVVRCDLCTMGYRIAICFETALGQVMRHAA